MAHRLPDDVNEAVVMIPDDIHPYGVDCHVSKPVQSIMHHYNVNLNSIQILEEEEFFELRDLRMANPDGDEAAKALFARAIEGRIPGHLQTMKVRLGFRRALRPDPFGAIVITPVVAPVVVVAPSSDAADPRPRPAKRPRGVATSSASGSDGASGVASAGAGAVASSESAPAASASSELNGMFGSSDEEDDDLLGVAIGDDAVDADAVDADAVDVDGDKLKQVPRRKDVVTLFNDLANEVLRLSFVL